MLGKPIPKKLRAEMGNDPFYSLCARNIVLNDHICHADPLTGKLIDWEHAIRYAGSKVNEKWAIIPACWWSHRGPGLKKEIHVWIALNRATDEELLAHSKAIDLIRERARLNAIYGLWEPRNKNAIEGQKQVASGINYPRDMFKSGINY